MAKAKFTQEDDDLLAELGVDVEQKKKAAKTPREERIIAGFEEIQRFVEEHGRPPLHGEDKDIFERLYATRLDQIRKQDECVSLLLDMDHQGLLSKANTISEPGAEYNTDDELLAALGVEAPKEGDITRLKHVKSQAEKKAAEEIANRTVCADFEKFKPLFDQVQDQLARGLLEGNILKSQKGQAIMADISKGDWFIVNGQKAYIAEVSKDRIYGFDKNDHRLRVIFDNGTESELLLRSMQKALYIDDASRRIVSISAGPLFDSAADAEDQESGTIYVLRSLSEDPVIRENQKVFHKIGVTGGSVEKRIANAKQDPTFLMADVEVVRTYKLFNINRAKLEKIIHRIFSNAKLNIELKDRFGKPIVPREWFLVPEFIIDQAVEKIRDGSIDTCKYDPKSVSLIENS